MESGTQGWASTRLVRQSRRQGIGKGQEEGGGETGHCAIPTFLGCLSCWGHLVAFCAGYGDLCIAGASASRVIHL